MPEGEAFSDFKRFFGGIQGDSLDERNDPDAAGGFEAAVLCFCSNNRVAGLFGSDSSRRRNVCNVVVAGCPGNALVRCILVSLIYSFIRRLVTILSSSRIHYICIKKVCYSIVALKN